MKNITLYIIIKFYSMVKTQYQRQICTLQSDNNTKFVDAILGTFLSQKEIRHQTSCTYTLELNGLAERKNRQILGIVWASLLGMNMPKYYWGKAIKSAAYLINRTPSRVINF